jgi:hypothetical protein
MNITSGRAARRGERFGPKGRRKGAGWTRAMKKGRTKRLDPNAKTDKETT